MRFESGPLSELLNTKEIVDAADPYIRILIKVPEAYLLLFPLATSRPGLLVLDADARRVHSIALPGQRALRQAGSGVKSQAQAIAKLLDAVVDYPAVEMFRVTIVGQDGAFRDAVDELDAVEETTFQKGVLRIAVSEGELPPTKLDELASQHKVELRWHNPVAVTLRPRADMPALKGIPGVWYTSDERAWVADLLLKPKALEAATADLEARVYELPGIPKGPGGNRVAAAPLSVPGVLSIFPDIFGETETVVGRKGKVRWADVTKAFERAGVNAKVR